MQKEFYVSVFTSNGSDSDYYKHQVLKGYLEFERSLGSINIEILEVVGRYNGETELSLKLTGPDAERLAKGTAKQYNQDSYLEVIDYGVNISGWLHYSDGRLPEFIGYKTEINQNTFQNGDGGTFENGEYFTFEIPKEIIAV